MQDFSYQSAEAIIEELGRDLEEAKYKNNNESIINENNLELEIEAEAEVKEYVSGEKRKYDGYPYGGSVDDYDIWKESNLK